MQKALTLEEFYRQRLGILPSEIIGRVGQFNVFTLDDFVPGVGPMPYSRKDYYKISLIAGPHTVHYADKTLEVAHNMLLFANPHVPYNWTPATKTLKGRFCVFTEDFFKGYGNFKDYPMFRPGGTPIISITDAEFDDFKIIYEKMMVEINTDYEYKYDVLRNLVLDLIHAALKLRPAIIRPVDGGELHAAERITRLFFELVERQFPIESAAQQIHLRTPGEFAEHLNVHSNHLNKVLKETTGKTTSQLLAERITLEARALLKHTDWTINEIAMCLGFEDPSHFVKFFKKSEQTTPRAFRG